MSIAHPPSIFVSSTCYDLAQVRNDLRLFLESLGMVPVLSEYSTFPVDPNLDTIGNCRAVIKHKADIFILVVGGRYGSETENGKSVTNLEYLEAKAKGIPCYIFVQKPILTALPIWKKNRSGDFSGLVDSTKLFEFVDSLGNPKENWVFPFEYAEDIIEILRRQMAYLFMDALSIRTKLLHNGLSETLQDLSGAALLLAVEKPPAWEYKLFCQVLSDEISRMADIKRDLNYGLTFGKSVSIDDPAEIFKWGARKSGEMKLFLESANVLLNVAFPKAVGAPGEPGNVEEIAYIAKRLAESYRSILEWTAEFRHIQVKEEFSHLMELFAFMSHNAIEEMETFPINYRRKIDDALQQYEETKQSQSFKFTLTLTCPNNTELRNEISRLR
ncbi:MAG: DUF4062 domain-containing protein, partial [Methanotrichaceae archaeon]